MGSYGSSRAGMLVTRGRYEEAITEATSAHESDPTDPEPLADRAAALVSLERYAEAVKDLEEARALDRATGTPDDELFDDDTFSALLGWARQAASKSLDEALALLDRYGLTWPRGRHRGHAEEWKLRLRGELPTPFVKRRLDDGEPAGG